MLSIAHQNKIFKIALPKIGAGLGGLNWNEVKSVIDKTANDYLDINLFIVENYSFQILLNSSSVMRSDSFNSSSSKDWSYNIDSPLWGFSDVSKTLPLEVSSICLLLLHSENEYKIKHFLHPNISLQILLPSYLNIEVP